jgi:hypothetical protein
MGGSAKQKKNLFQIFYSLLLYKWNFKNGKCFVTLFVSAVGGAGGWRLEQLAGYGLDSTLP